MTHTLLSVDPGKSDAGVAFYVEGQLAELACIIPKGKAEPFEVALHIALWWRRCMHNVGDPEGRVSVLVIEGQQIYGGPRRQDPNDLLPLAQVVGGVMARVDAFERHVVLPRIWTRSVPKEVRHRRWLGTLSTREQGLVAAIKAPKTKIHNAIDAACLGAYHLGRIRTEPEGGYAQ